MYPSLLLLALVGLSVTTTTLSLPATPPSDPEEKRLIKTGPGTPAKWMTDAEMQTELFDKHTHFMDITYTQDLEKGAEKIRSQSLDIPSGVTMQSVVEPLLAKANTDLMKAVLPPFTVFNNRYYKTSTGAQSAIWLFGQLQQLVAQNNVANLAVTVNMFNHTWGQNSAILRIEGLNGNQETVILGAHQDSINQRDRLNGRAPGADDDGSGVVTLMEALRVLLISGYQPLRPIEFQFYAGEEVGLLGSQAIAQEYQQKGRVVAGMFQLDMTGYPIPGAPDIGIVTDNVDPDLTNLVRGLVTAYSTLQSGDFECGYGCSDHASWNVAGYPSAIPFEMSQMPDFSRIHTPNDKLETVDYDHALEFVKLAIGFAVEMAHQ
jgi:leucyl aminopeptidase